MLDGDALEDVLLEQARVADFEIEDCTKVGRTEVVGIEVLDSKSRVVLANIREITAWLEAVVPDVEKVVEMDFVDAMLAATDAVAI